MTPTSPPDPMQPALTGGPHATPVRDGHARQCTARTRSGARCRAYAVEEQAVCRMHGGASPQARRAAQKRRAERDATALLEVIWDPNAAPVTDPVGSLQRLAGQIQHAVDVLGARVDTADLDGATGLAWARAMRELRLALEGMERLDLAGKHLELEHQRASVVVVAFQAVLDVLGLLPADRSLAIDTFLGRLDQLVPAVVRGAVE